MAQQNEAFMVERIENGYITRANTARVQRTLYHSNTGGVISEFNKAFGTQRLNKDLTSRVLNVVSDTLKEKKRQLETTVGNDLSATNEDKENQNTQNVDS